MELEPSGDMTIRASTLKTNTEIILFPDNQITVRKSKLDATETLSGYGFIFIGTGFSSTPSLHVLVRKTNMKATQDIEIGGPVGHDRGEEQI